MNKKDRLWQPSEARCLATEVAQFALRLQQAGLFDWQGDFQRLWQWSVTQHERFWSELWDWHGIIGSRKGPVFVAEKSFIDSYYFPRAKLNFAENLLCGFDDPESADLEAMVWQDERGQSESLSRAELAQQVMAVAGWLRAQGVERGDRVAAYIPNLPAAVVTMLASAAIGAVYSSCSTDFGFNGVLDRFAQIGPKVLVGVDGYQYGGKRISRLDELQQLAEAMPSVEKVLLLGYLDPQVELPSALFEHWHIALEHEPFAEFVPLSFNDPLYILYSSGTTGAPKCIVHGVGGSLIQHIKELRLHCDVKAGDRVFYYTTCGWMMWNWLVSALAVKATVVLYEGNPMYPGPERLWQLAEQQQLTLFGTSAKYLDALRKTAFEPKNQVDLSALRCLCSTGSPLSREGFEFVYAAIKADLQLASISGGTDIVSCFVLGSPVQPVYAGEIQTRGLGMNVAVLNEHGASILEEAGELCCLQPFPSKPVGFWNDADGERYRQAYFSTYANIWRHGDWASINAHGGVVIHGRSDAVLNPGGVRIGTAEIYRPVEAFAEVLEALVIGQQWQDDVRVVLFVRLQAGLLLDDDLKYRLRQAIRRQASPRHVPAVILAVNDLPRTRSGKISELAVRDVIHGRAIKNTEALANPESLKQFQQFVQPLQNERVQ